MINFLRFIIIIFVLFSLASCDNFKRFGQEKFICAENALSINQIDIIKTNSIEKAYMVIQNDEIQLEVEFLSKNKVLLKVDEFKINIDKNNNEITVSNGNKIHFLKCKNETFNM